MNSTRTFQSQPLSKVLHIVYFLLLILPSAFFLVMIFMGDLGKHSKGISQKDAKQGAGANAWAVFSGIGT